MARKTDSELAAIISGRCDNGTFGGEGKLARERELVQKFRDESCRPGCTKATATTSPMTCTTATRR